MAANQSSPPQRSGLSLYANLLEGSAPGTISSAPVSYNKANEANNNQEDAAKKQQAQAESIVVKAASLRFQPTIRPQLAAQKAKAKAIASKLAQQVASASTTTAPDPKPEPIQENPQPQPVGLKTTAADWTATLSEDEDVNAYFASTRQKRKKRKKNQGATEARQDWDDIYDPSRPNNYEEYKHSEEKIREVREWKDLLYRHRMSRRRSSDYDSDRSEIRPMNKQFAPPPSISFAPPARINEREKDKSDIEYAQEDDDDEEYVPPPPPDPSNITNDASGEDAYMRRLRMSQPAFMQAPPPPPSPPPPPPEVAPPLPPQGQISRAPVRYNLPLPPADLPASDAELMTKLEEETQVASNPDGEQDDASQPRSSRPGQAGFAERLMMKYGWTKGSGLGATGSGITNALYVKADKRKKKSDAEGGGFVTPATIGKILGGQRSKASEEAEGTFGAMSEVIRLENMLNGMDVHAELRRIDPDSGGLMQEIGEECGEKYGSVERVYIHMDIDDNAYVFVKFVSQLSALRAVNALEGRIFNGNEIKARFWDREKFDNDVYE